MDLCTNSTLYWANWNDSLSLVCIYGVCIADTVLGFIVSTNNTYTSKCMKHDGTSSSSPVHKFHLSMFDIMYNENSLFIHEKLIALFGSNKVNTQFCFNVFLLSFAFVFLCYESMRSGLHSSNQYVIELYQRTSRT